MESSEAESYFLFYKHEIILITRPFEFFHAMVNIFVCLVFQ